MVKLNPCKGVKQFKENVRERYITNQEYDALYSVSPTLVQAAMELAYLCCARQGDILGLAKSQLLQEGIFIKQGKRARSRLKHGRTGSGQLSTSLQHCHSRTVLRAYMFCANREVSGTHAMDLTAAGKQLGTRRLLHFLS